VRNRTLSVRGFRARNHAHAATLKKNRVCLRWRFRRHQATPPLRVLRLCPVTAPR